MLAASSRLDGIVNMNCRSRNVPNALNAAGTTSPVYESSRCSFTITAKLGIIVTTPGTISVARYSLNTASLPGQRKRANAYAAMEQVRSCVNVTQSATNALLK